MIGGDGNDRLDGQSGSDTMTGGLGADSFIWAFHPTSAGSADVVTDLDFKIDDLIIRGFGDNPTSYIGSSEELYSINLSGLSVVELGGDTLVTIEDNGIAQTLHLLGVSAWFE